MKAKKISSQFERFVRIYQESEVVFQRNTTGREMYVIYSGKVGLFVEGTQGKETILTTLGPGAFFGEMALIDDSPRSATAAAVEGNTQLIVLDRAKFLYLVRHQPEFALIIMQTLCQRIREGNLALMKAREGLRLLKSNVGET